MPLDRQREAAFSDEKGRAGCAPIALRLTHQVADGMHGAIVKAIKTSDPQAKELPAAARMTRW